MWNLVEGKQIFYPCNIVSDRDTVFIVLSVCRYNPVRCRTFLWLPIVSDRDTVFIVLAVCRYNLVRCRTFLWLPVVSDRDTVFIVLSVCSQKLFFLDSETWCYSQGGGGIVHTMKNSIVFEELPMSVRDLTVANPIFLVTWKASCKINISFDISTVNLRENNSQWKQVINKKLY